MKTLLLMRHAKSDWGDSALPDIDRPLNDRGERDAPRIGAELRKRGVLPDLILSSPAARARRTVKLLVERAGLEIATRYVENLYGASSAELRRQARELPDTNSCALFVGHNPGTEEAVARLSGRTAPMPTAALACLTFNVERWTDIADGEATLAWRIVPKDLDDVLA